MDKIPSLPGLGENLAPLAQRKAEAAERTRIEVARRKAAGTFGVKPKEAKQDFISAAFSDAASGVESAKRLFGQLQPPNQAEAKAGAMRVGLETTVNAPEGFKSETKIREAKRINRAALGPNQVAIQ